MKGPVGAAFDLQAHRDWVVVLLGAQPAEHAKPEVVAVLRYVEQGGELVSQFLFVEVGAHHRIDVRPSPLDRISFESTQKAENFGDRFPTNIGVEKSLDHGGERP